VYENLELEKILALNPQIDEELLKEGRELLRKMREAGIRKRGYNLTSPYARRYARIPKPVSEEDSVDPRTVRVGRSFRSRNG